MKPKLPIVTFDHSKIDRTRGVTINVQLAGDFVVCCVSEEGVPDRALAFEIGHYPVAERQTYLSKFFKALSANVRYNSKHFKVIPK